MLGNALLLVLLVPPLGFLFAVAQGDLENLLYVSQVFGGDLFTYLSWSEAISSRAFEIAFVVFGMVAGLAFFMELAKGYARHHEDKAERAAGRTGIIERWVPSRLGGFWRAGSFAWLVLDTLSRALAAVVLVVTLTIWPGLIAAYFLIFAFFSRVPGVLRALKAAEGPPMPKLELAPQLALAGTRGTTR